MSYYFWPRTSAVFPLQLSFFSPSASPPFFHLFFFPSCSAAASAVVVPVAPAAAASSSAAAASSSSSSAASSSSSSSSSSTYGGAIQIGVGADAVLLDDESKVDALDGEEAARMLDALQALEARVAGLKQKVAEKAAAAVAAGGPEGGK